MAEGNGKCNKVALTVARSCSGNGTQLMANDLLCCVVGCAENIDSG
jgi:hypothetical protein